MNAYRRMLRREAEAAKEAAKEELRHNVHEEVKVQFKHATQLFDSLMLYTLYNDFGFDKDKLVEFYKAIDSEHGRMCDLLGKDDVEAQEHYATFKMYLKEYAGLDMDELYAEMEGKK